MATASSHSPITTAAVMPLKSTPETAQTDIPTKPICDKDSVILDADARPCWNDMDVDITDSVAQQTTSLKRKRAFGSMPPTCAAAAEADVKLIVTSESEPDDCSVEHQGLLRAQQRRRRSLSQDHSITHSSSDESGTVNLASRQRTPETDGTSVALSESIAPDSPSPQLNPPMLGSLRGSQRHSVSVQIPKVVSASHMPDISLTSTPERMDISSKNLPSIIIPSTSRIVPSTTGSLPIVACRLRDLTAAQQRDIQSPRECKTALMLSYFRFKFQTQAGSASHPSSPSNSQHLTSQHGASTLSQSPSHSSRPRNEHAEVEETSVHATKSTPVCRDLYQGAMRSALWAHIPVPYRNDESQNEDDDDDDDDDGADGADDGADDAISIASNDASGMGIIKTTQSATQTDDTETQLLERMDELAVLMTSPQLPEIAQHTLESANGGVYTGLNYPTDGFCMPPAKTTLEHSKLCPPVVERRESVDSSASLSSTASVSSLSSSSNVVNPVSPGILHRRSSIESLSKLRSRRKKHRANRQRKSAKRSAKQSQKNNKKVNDPK
jgi:hypothetical protein